MQSPHLKPEPRWPAVVGMLAVGGLLLALPESLTLGPRWLLPGLVTLLLTGSVALHWISEESVRAVTILGYVISGVLTMALAWSLAALVLELPAKHQPAIGLLGSAGVLWLSTILVFASWYWRLDAGGPHLRSKRSDHNDGSFLFPQMQQNHLAGQRPWQPGFVDYLFLAFTTSTAFSPTDVAPLTRWAKLLMMVQSMISLGTLAIVAARAVNML